ncbi:hypothetical protein J2T11_003652 [Paenarthrobacter nicotinovorans]|jgi:hypothetical protein|nr:hypothetical protein [Paenarthrobacter nicotinovorans]
MFDKGTIHQPQNGGMMNAGRWGLLVVGSVILIISVILAIQGSIGLWFTAAAMAILIFATLRSGLKEIRQSPDSDK